MHKKTALKGAVFFISAGFFPKKSFLGLFFVANPLVDQLVRYTLQTHQSQPIADEQAQENEHAKSRKDDQQGEEESDEFHGRAFEFVTKIHSKWA